MTGLIVRLVILFGIVAGVAYAVTRRIKSRQDRARLDSLESDLRALQADQELGIFSESERAHVLTEVEAEMQSLSGRQVRSEEGQAVASERGETL